MNASDQQIDLIVQQVLKALQIDQLPEVLDQVEGDQNGCKNSRWLPGRVISIAQLEQLESLPKQLTVDEKAIVTPAALDWLKEKNITLKTEAGTAQKTKRIGVIAHSTRCQFAENIAQRVGTGANYEPNSDQLIQIAIRLLRSHHSLVIVTRHEYALCTEVNRVQDAYAVAPNSLSELRRAFEQMPVNAVLVDPFRTRISEASTWVDLLLNKRGGQ